LRSGYANSSRGRRRLLDMKSWQSEESESWRERRIRKRARQGKPAGRFTRSRADGGYPADAKDSDVVLRLAPGLSGRAIARTSHRRTRLRIEDSELRSSPAIENAWRLSVTRKAPEKSTVARKKKRRKRRCAGGHYVTTAVPRKRRTFKTKAAAKKNKPKNMSLYKVAGGWRLSKRREPAPF